MSTFINVKNALELREFLNGMLDEDLRMTVLKRTRGTTKFAPVRIYRLRVDIGTLESGEEITEFVF